MNILFLSILFLPFLAAVPVYFLDKKHPIIRDIVSLLTMVFMPVLLFYLLRDGYSALDFSLSNVFFVDLTFRINELGFLYALIASFMWLVTTVFSREYFISRPDELGRYHAFNLLTYGSTVGVFLSGDLITTFVFFEIMSFTSFVSVIHDRGAESIKAAKLYLTVSVVGGMVMLMGLFMLDNIFGDLTFSALAGTDSLFSEPKSFIACLLLLFGFGAKAGMYPLHIWLPKAHPVAPAPASALLSGILTKTGVYGILVVTVSKMLYQPAWGKSLLLLGTITMVLGAVLGLFSINIKRTLACSSMSQIGFILVGTGLIPLLEEYNLASSGVVFHMFNHSVIKLVLFICAGIIFMNTNRLELNDIRGFGRKKPLLMIPFVLTACSIAGIPGFSGYFSKTLLHEAIVELSGVVSGTQYYAVKAVEYLFLLSGALTLAYMTKLFVCVFIEKNSNTAVQEKYDSVKHYVSVKTILLITATSFISVIMFVNPLPFAEAFLLEGFFGTGATLNIDFYSLECLKGALISVITGSVIYLVVVRKLMLKDDRYIDFSNNTFSVEKAYGAVFGFCIRLLCVISHFICDLTDFFILGMRKTVYSEVKVKESKKHDTVPSNVGKAINTVASFTNEKLLKNGKKRYNFDTKLIAVTESVKLTSRRIMRNFSFAMMMTCLGICATLLYILFLA